MRGGLIALLICCIALSSLAVAQVQLEFGQQTATYRSVLQLRNGSRLLVGSMPRVSGCETSSSVIALTFLGDQPSSAPSFGGGGNTIPRVAALDPGGNIWIAGSTDSDDFNLVNPIFAEKVPYGTTGFVVELDPTGRRLLFSTFLGAQQSKTSSPIRYTAVTALAIDGPGNVYVGGETADTDFPTRGGFNGCRPAFSASGDTTACSFVVKITPAWTLAYSTTVTTGGACTGSQSSCIGRSHRSATVDGMAVDGSGAVTISGVLGETYDFRTGFFYPGGGYICRVASDGSKLLWTLTYAGARKILVALDPVGNVDVFGRSVPVANVLPPVLGTPTLFAAQVGSDGSGFTYRKVLGQSIDAMATGILPDKLGNAYLAGTSSSPEFSQGESGVPNLGSDFVLKIDQSGSPVQTVLRLPRGAIDGPPSFNADSALMMPGVGGALLTVPNDYYGLGPPAVVGFANSASYALNTGIFPGALLTLYGFNLPSSEQDLQVRVSGQPARILYAGPNQINLQVPFKVPSFAATFPVTLSPGNVSVQVSSSQSLGIFTSDGAHASALNQDGSVNSQANPAAAGSVVSLFGTGAIWPSGMIDGAVPPTPLLLNPDLNRFEALSSNETPLAILYAGAAPGIINGVFQINVLLPPSASVQLRSYGIILKSRTLFGILSSNAVQVYIN